MASLHPPLASVVFLSRWRVEEREEGASKRDIHRGSVSVSIARGGGKPKCGDIVDFLSGPEEEYTRSHGAQEPRRTQ